MKSNKTEETGGYIATFKGKCIDKMSKLELIEALSTMASLYDNCLKEKKQERDALVSFRWQVI